MQENTLSIPKLYKIPHEKDGFRLPPPGTQELLYYITWLRIDDNKLLFERAFKNVPKADIDLLINKTKETEGEIVDIEKKRLQYAQMLAFNILANRICDHCGDKKDITKLSICSDCALSWYCSKECQQRHLNTHKLRCCQPDGPLDRGYQAIALLNTKK